MCRLLHYYNSRHQFNKVVVAIVIVVVAAVVNASLLSRLARKQVIFLKKQNITKFKKIVKI